MTPAERKKRDGLRVKEKRAYRQALREGIFDARVSETARAMDRTMSVAKLAGLEEPPGNTRKFWRGVSRAIDHIDVEPLALPMPENDEQLLALLGAIYDEFGGDKTRQAVACILIARAEKIEKLRRSL